MTVTGDTGLLRDVSDGHLHLADLDGEEITVPVDESGSITIPHPAIIADIADWREFAAELGVSQGVDQLFRDIYVKPDDAVGRQRAVRAYTDGRYEKAQVLIGRSRGGGFTTTMQEVSLIVVEDGVEVRISLDIDAWDPWEDGTIGELSFYQDGQSLPLEKWGQSPGPRVFAWPNSCMPAAPWNPPKNRHKEKKTHESHTYCGIGRHAAARAPRL